MSLLYICMDKHFRWSCYFRLFSDLLFWENSPSQLWREGGKQDPSVSKNRCVFFIGLPGCSGIYLTQTDIARGAPTWRQEHSGAVSLHNCEHCHLSLLISSAPVCIFISAMCGRGSAAAFASVEGERFFLTSLNPQSGKTTGCSTLLMPWLWLRVTPVLPHWDSLLQNK